MENTHKQKHHGEGFPFNKHVCPVAECCLTEKKLRFRQTDEEVPYRWGAAILGQRSYTVPVPVLHTQINTSFLACPQKLPRPHGIFLVRRNQSPVPLRNIRCCYFISSPCSAHRLRKILCRLSFTRSLSKGAWTSAATTRFCI